MTSTTGKSFLDTNVLVYAFDGADREKQDRALATLASIAPSATVLSSQVLSEFYVVTTKRIETPLSESEAGEAVRSLSQLPTVAVTAKTVLQALDVRVRWQTSYWDALIVAAALSAGCERILSEDMATGAVVAGIRIENPFD